MEAGPGIAKEREDELPAHGKVLQDSPDEMTGTHNVESQAGSKGTRCSSTTRLRVCLARIDQIKRLRCKSGKSDELAVGLRFP